MTALQAWVAIVGGLVSVLGLGLTALALVARAARVVGRLETQLSGVESRLTSRVDTLETNMTNSFMKVEQRLNHLETRLDAHLERHGRTA